MKTFSLPNLDTSFFVFSNKGPFLPSTTLLNSLKSHSTPSLVILSPSLANCSAVNLPFLPLGNVYNTWLAVLANVSSKSSTLIPFLLASDFLSIAKFVANRTSSARLDSFKLFLSPITSKLFNLYLFNNAFIFGVYLASSPTLSSRSSISLGITSKYNPSRNS